MLSLSKKKKRHSGLSVRSDRRQLKEELGDCCNRENVVTIKFTRSQVLSKMIFFRREESTRLGRGRDGEVEWKVVGSDSRSEKVLP